MRKLNDSYKASVIIPTYNRSKLLDYSLLSLLKQDLDKDEFEVIVADDGSSDDTREVVEKYGEALHIKYVYQADMGFRPASARNMGIRAAAGEIGIFVDSGVLLNSDCIRQHLDFYSRMNKKVAIVGYVYGFERIKDFEQQLIELLDPARVAESISRVSGDKLFSDIREDHYVKYKDQIHRLPAPWFYFWTCHVSAPLAEIRSAGLFDERFDGRWGVEDNDLAYRLHRQGVEIHLVRRAEAIHYPHEKEKGERKMDGYENCKYFNQKYRTRETQTFLDHYLDWTDFKDINQLLLEMQLPQGA